MSESSRRKKMALAGIQESSEEIEKRNQAYAKHKELSKYHAKAHRFIRGSFDPETRKITR